MFVCKFGKFVAKFPKVPCSFIANTRNEVQIEFQDAVVNISNLQAKIQSIFSKQIKIESKRHCFYKRALTPL